MDPTHKCFTFVYLYGVAHVSMICDLLEGPAPHVYVLVWHDSFVACVTWLVRRWCVVGFEHRAHVYLHMCIRMTQLICPWCLVCMNSHVYICVWCDSFTRLTFWRLTWCITRLAVVEPSLLYVLFFFLFCHGVATISRLLKVIGLFCRILSLL